MPSVESLSPLADDGLRLLLAFGGAAVPDTVVPLFDVPDAPVLVADADADVDVAVEFKGDMICISLTSYHFDPASVPFLAKAIMKGESVREHIPCPKHE